MSRILHLSDLHFSTHDLRQPKILDGLIQTAGALFREGTKIDALFISGNVFATNRAEAAELDGFIAVLNRLDAALGGKVRTVIIPGNHDRRAEGVFAPWSGELFKQLHARLSHQSHVHVAGLQAPFLAEIVSVPGLDADVVALDSTWVPGGTVSAGGMIRREDLLQLADTLRSSPPGRPVVFLTHHHLVPTPVTDVSRINTTERPYVEQFMVNEVLAGLVGNGDREDLATAALGAGSALTALQQLNRGVLVLHGENRCPTVRLMKGIASDEGDVLLVSAGRSGIAEAFDGANFPESATQWPSFNLLDVSGGSVSVTTVAWSAETAAKHSTPRPLVKAQQSAARWSIEHAPVPEVTTETVLAVNEAEYSIVKSVNYFDRHDLVVSRQVRGADPKDHRAYWEVVQGPSEARVVSIVCAGLPQDEARTPAKLRLPLNSRSSWKVLGGVTATTAESHARYGTHGAYEAVSLLNRARSEVATLKLNLPSDGLKPFGTVTDLTSGRERSVPLSTDGNAVELKIANCPARTLLRIYWPLRVS